MKKRRTSPVKRAVNKINRKPKSTNQRLAGIEVQEKKHSRLEKATVSEIRALKRQLKRIVKIHKYSLIEHPVRLLLFQFAIGLVRGLGSFMGATIVVGIIYYIFGMLGYTDALKQLLDIGTL